MFGTLEGLAYLHS